MDVLTAASAILLLGGWVWLFCKVRRLAISERLTKAIANRTVDAILAVDERDRIVLFNAAAERLFGRATRSVIGVDIATLMPDYRSACRSHVGPGLEEASLAARNGPGMKALHADGTVFFVSASVSKANVGRQAFRAIIVRDVSEQRRMHDAAHDSEARYRVCVELSPVATWLSRDETIVCVNPACLALFGATDAAEVLGRPSSDWLDPEGCKGVRQQLVGRSHAPGLVARPTSGKVTRLDGLTRDVDVTAIAFDHARPASILVALQDVTLRNMTEQELRESRHALRELARTLQIAREVERTSLARQLHEELAQRLNAVKMEVAALNASQDTHPQRAARTLASDGRIDTQLDELVDLVRRVTADLRPPMLDDLGLAATLEWLARDLLARYGLRVHTDLRETDIDTTAAAVLYRIARDALERARLRAPDSRISLRLLESGGFVRLTVREDDFVDDDLANGLPPAMLFAIREHVALVGGDAEWKTHRTGGQELIVHLSLLGRKSLIP
ncbi:histidine kinase (plasmid) [Burkholderia sp. JP2-270]|uniref:PAS domain-containing sensor histidine kinase n=1 Tax=Burkholderia sp. JP2-270 TaxID=2217913 RepID=UPI000DA3299C|nr:PAS domain S-box protein [Burkholderia sp. JP2-270]AWV05537.1 histidine kinase [Burkholderia sp. JP2-270]